MTDIAAVFGVCSVVAGCYLISVPLALIVGGSVVLFVAVSLTPKGKR